MAPSRCAGGGMYAAQPRRLRRVLLRSQEGEELKDVENGGKPKPEPKRWHREEFLSLLPFLWPKEEPRLKLSIVFAFLCLLASKGFNICVPIALKAAVDAASKGRLPLKPVVLYGLFRFLTDSTKEARDCLFKYNATYASRKISLRVFNH